MKIKTTYLVLTLAILVTTGCQKDEDTTPRADAPISFNSEVPEQNTTRATAPLFNYQKSMKVYGTKTIGGATKVVFPYYRLNYLDDDKDWVYEASRDASLTGQIVKYWDHDATQYDFIASAPYEHTDISADGKKVTVKDLKAELANASTLVETPYLYSVPKTIATADFDKTVMMTFRVALCRVRVAFIFKTAQTDAPGSVTLTDITFTPSGSYARTGNVEVDYTSGAGTPVYTVTPATSSSGPLNFQNVTIDYPGNTVPVYAEDWYYMIPHSSSDPACDWTMKVGSLTSKNTAVVDKSFMKWEPGHEYIYKFQLSSAETDPTIKFIECVNTAITGWTDADGSDATLYNW